MRCIYFICISFIKIIYADVSVFHNRPCVFRHCRDSINFLWLYCTHRPHGGNNTVSIGSVIVLARHHNGIHVSLAIIR